MFGRKSAQPNSKGAREIGLLGVDTRFKGHIRFRGTLRLDGQVEGTIVAEEGSGSVLIVNRKAVVTGNIVSDSVLISGSVLGNIKALEKVEIFRTGTLRGDVFTADIVIEAGAEYEGNCRMIKNLNPEQREKIFAHAFAHSPGGGKGNGKTIQPETPTEGGGRSSV